MKNTEFPKERKIELLAFNETVDCEYIDIKYEYSSLEKIFRENKKQFALLSDEEIETKYNEKWLESCCFWSKCKTWKLEYISLLLLKIDPRTFRELEEKTSPETTEKIKRLSITFLGNDVLRRYDDVLLQLKSCFSESSLDCIKVIEWVEERNISFPKELAQAIREFNNIPDWKKECKSWKAKHEGSEKENKELKKTNKKLQSEKGHLKNRNNTSEMIIAAFVDGCDKSIKFESKNSSISKAQELLSHGGWKFDKEILGERWKSGMDLLKKNPKKSTENG